MTIVEFLTARYDEDEAAARAVIDSNEWGWASVDFNSSDAEEHGSRWSPPRVLADIAAKRAIMELAEEASGLDMQVDGEFRVGRRDITSEPYVGDLILRQLAQQFADHPDFDPAWRE